MQDDEQEHRKIEQILKKNYYQEQKIGTLQLQTLCKHGLPCSLPSRSLQISNSILSAKFHSQLLQMFPSQTLSLSLLYKSSLHGFSAREFHSRCDQQGPTVAVVRSKGNRTFGGYAQVAWDNKDRSIAGAGKSFLF